MGSIMDDVSLGRAYGKPSNMNLGGHTSKLVTKEVLIKKKKFGPTDFPCSKGHVDVDYMTPKEKFEFKQATRPKQKPIDIPEIFDDGRSSCSGTTRGSLALRGLKTSVGQLGKAKDLRR
jgi:hypothetical protein